MSGTHPQTVQTHAEARYQLQSETESPPMNGCHLACGSHSDLTLSLTGSSLSVVPGVYVPFALPSLCSCHLLHSVNFRDTQLGIESEVHFPRPDGQVPVVPVPQLLQVLVVQDIEGVVPGSTDSHISNPPSPRLPPATQSKCGSVPIRGLLTGAMQKQAVAVTTGGGKMSQGQCFEIDRTLIL